MDKTDAKILSELDMNPRIALSALAGKLRISQQVADYRVQRMLRKGIISKFGTIINLKSLGLEHYRIFFTFGSKEYPKDEVFEYLKQRKGVYWAARIGGKYDLHIVLFVRNFEEFDDFIDDFNKHFPNLIKDYKSCYVINYCIYKHKYIHKEYSCIEYGYNDLPFMTDELDNHILIAMKDNCRISSTDLAKKHNISYKTVLNRIKLMEQKKVILGYRLFFKSSEAKPFVILFSYKNYSKAGEQSLMNYLKINDGVTQAVRLFGLWNLFVHTRMESYETVQKFIIELRGKFDIIDDYEIIPVFEDISINLFPLENKNI